MEMYRWFWSLLTVIVLVWYSTITLYIAYQGVIDIKVMLKKLRTGTFDSDA